MASTAPLRASPTVARGGVDAARLLLLVALAAAGLWLWDVPWLAPLRLLVVLVHETGHALPPGFPGQGGWSSARTSRAVLEHLHQAGWRGRCTAGYVGSAVPAHCSSSSPSVGSTGQCWRWASGSPGWGWLCRQRPSPRLLSQGRRGAARPLLSASGGVRAVVMVHASPLYALFDLRDDLWHSSVGLQRRRPARRADPCPGPGGPSSGPWSRWRCWERRRWCRCGGRRNPRSPTRSGRSGPWPHPVRHERPRVLNWKWGCGSPRSSDDTDVPVVVPGKRRGSGSFRSVESGSGTSERIATAQVAPPTSVDKDSVAEGASRRAGTANRGWAGVMTAPPPQKGTGVWTAGAARPGTPGGPENRSRALT